MRKWPIIIIIMYYYYYYLCYYYLHCCVCYLFCVLLLSSWVVGRVWYWKNDHIPSLLFFSYLLPSTTNNKIIYNLFFFALDDVVDAPPLLPFFAFGRCRRCSTFAPLFAEPDGLLPLRICCQICYQLCSSSAKTRT